jgi:ABC-2 type transport system ATP-binding protein
MPEMIRVRGLTKRFGRFTAVDGIDFTIDEGEIIGFLGPNGAGKTTTIRMINGLLKTTAGMVEIAGMNFIRHRRKIREIVGYMSQKFSLYPLLTGRENIEFFGGILGLRGDRLREKMQDLEQSLPTGFLDRRVGQIPPGHRQQISLFACLLGDPQIIFLDEPTSGVDPENRRRFWHEIYRLKEKGKTILVTTHSLDEAEYADRILIIDRGSIIERGEPVKLCRKYGVDSIQEVFLRAVRSHEAV